MARKTETREILGKTFSLTQLSFPQARSALLRMGKILAPLMAKGAGKGKGSEDVEAALLSAVGNLSESDLEHFTKAFGFCTEYVQGDRARRLDREDVQEELFAGDGFPLYLHWLKESFVFNFGDFFGEALRAAKP